MVSNLGPALVNTRKRALKKTVTPGSAVFSVMAVNGRLAMTEEFDLSVPLAFLLEQQRTIHFLQKLAAYVYGNFERNGSFKCRGRDGEGQKILQADGFVGGRECGGLSKGDYR